MHQPRFYHLHFYHSVLRQGGRLLLSLFILCATAFSTSAQYRVDSWTTDNGLPQNSVYDILQTQDGYLWFTTLDGLVRYDGARFKVFSRTNNKNIISNRFTALSQDKYGTLWIGAEEGSLIRYCNGSFTSYPAQGGIPGNFIYSLTVKNDSELVIRTRDNVAVWRDEKFLPYTPVAGEDQSPFIYWDREGAMWYTNQNGLHKWQDGVLTTYSIPQRAVITTVYEDRHGNLWMGTNGAGLGTLRGDKIIFTSSPEKVARRFFEDRRGNLWVVHGSGASILYEGKLARVKELDGKVITALYEDHEGGVWVGTFNNGIHRLTEQDIKVYTKHDGLAGDNIYPIYEDREGTIWIGDNGGLTRYRDGIFKAYTKKDGFPFSGVSALYQDKAGKLWVANRTVIGYFRDNKFTDLTKELGFFPPIYSIDEDRHGAIWLSTEAELFQLKDGKVRKYTPEDGLAGIGITKVLEDRSGTLWVATWGGLSHIKDGKFTSFTEADGLPSNHIRSLYEDADGILWVGTYDGGLARFTDGRFTTYTMEDGLFNNGVFCILEDARGYFWMSSNVGIYRVSRQQLNDFADGKITRIACVSYGKADGLLNAECNGGHQPAGIKARDGKLWIPTQQGVAVIDPAGISFNQQPPPVVIEGGKLDGAAINFDEVIEIAPAKENLEINYTALSFIKPDQVVFKYKMEGLNTNWIDAGTRRAAYYSHLPSGTYTFRLIAANSDGVWNDTGTSIQVRVIPSFYRTWWFLTLAVLSVVGAAVLIYERRVWQIQKAKAAQEEFTRQLIASQEAERRRIAAELHDGLGQNLIIIKNRAMMGSINSTSHPQGKEQFEEITDSAAQAIEEVRHIAYNLRPYHLERLGLTYTIKAIIERVFSTTEIQIISKLDSIDDLFKKEDEIQIYRIVQECINNIVKHSQATTATIEIRRSTDTVQVIISDNGCGFDVEQMRMHGGFGLTGLAERARLLGGTQTIESAMGQGTTVTIKLTIPAKSKDAEVNGKRSDKVRGSIKESL